MPDIDLYQESTDTYEELQNRRPDYAGARRAFLELAHAHINDKQQIILADFCCGTGNHSLLISQRFSVEKATLIDINQSFLDIAIASNINAVEVVPVLSDILDANLKPEHDLVISMFAYHHVPHQDKVRFLEVAREALKPGGLLLLGEIYIPDKETTRAYYDHLLDSIDPISRTPELEKFLRQTAESDVFEYKVSRKFAHEQLFAAGFRLLEGRKIWPHEGGFDGEVGTFVEVWGLSESEE